MMERERQQNENDRNLADGWIHPPRRSTDGASKCSRGASPNSPESDDEWCILRPTHVFGLQLREGIVDGDCSCRP